MKHLVGEPPEKQLRNRKPASLTDFVNILCFHTVCYFIDIPSLRKADFTATSFITPKKKKRKKWNKNMGA